MAEHQNYVLKVTAGRDYDLKNHQDVHVNTAKPVDISTDDIDASINVRIQDYRGLPKDSPATSPYFSNDGHKYDRYSIAYTFRLKNDVPGDKLVFGNDFDHPIRDRLPPGFNLAFRYLKSWIDPTIEGDINADEPYLYAPVLGSMNRLQVGSKGQSLKETIAGAGEKLGEGDDAITVIEEGAQGDGEDVRKEKSIPDAPNARMKHYAYEQYRKEFTFEKDRPYACDFFNSYLDFNEFAIKLPIITVPIVRYWDGQPLRYVLKNLETNEPLFVIHFTLIPADQLDAEDANDNARKQLADGDKESEHGSGASAPAPNDADID
ncbi:uncharacterized protein K452DRAFT_229718 [Aplosporella prunicola CBS 121167]|uniref:Domain of unknown function at the cortex 1 domain-containing protein n=1 Tax=Aplosporella prunicola CBS 121167 TaxID=1176127 RepID=A0A6A6B9Q2_9PEZI|nr:uncharacterized protein K452DRAFT_229718 [Aplosporella prunicola CBS 121167]KAF2141002.1 hypothetical protein K452DRAFT_229718 [Aplosporella prunicola CBS 121167]